MEQKSKLPIITGKDNPILRIPNIRIGKFSSPDLAPLLRQMALKMDELKGIGLAAPQVGKNLQLFIVDKLAFHKERSEWSFEGIANPVVSRGYIFINPVITTFPKPYEIMIEGCLSLPGWEGRVTRSRRIRIKAQNEKGEAFGLRARGLLAKVLQHELDHLKGILICDKWEHPKKIERKKAIGSLLQHTLKEEKIVFFGSSEYARLILEKLKGTPFAAHIVISHTRELGTLKENRYALGILAFFGGIIPSELLSRFRFGIINVHPSLLPKYRGPSPVQQTIIHGDTIAGVSIIRLDRKVDAGPILAQRKFPLEKSYTTPQLHHILFSLGADVLINILPSYLNGRLPLKAQDEVQATYTRLIKKEDGYINWQEPAFLIERKVRAYQPWPTAYTYFENHNAKKRLQILEAEVAEKNADGFLVPCGKGLLRIKKVRPEGKNEMSGEEFLRGYNVVRFE